MQKYNDYFKKFLKEEISFREIPEKFQTEELCLAAVKLWCSNIRFIKNPTQKMCEYVVSCSYDNLKYIKNPSEDVIDIALENCGYAIRFVKNPTDAQKLKAITKTPGALSFIKEPSNELINSAFEKNYSFLKYVKNPTDEQILKSVKKDCYILNCLNTIDFEFFKKICKIDYQALFLMDHFNFELDDNFIVNLINTQIDEPSFVFENLVSIKNISNTQYNRLLSKFLNSDFTLIRFARDIDLKLTKEFFDGLHFVNYSGIDSSLISPSYLLDELVQREYIGIFYEKLSKSNVEDINLYLYIYENYPDYFNIKFVPKHLQTLEMQKSSLNENILSIKYMNDSPELDKIFQELIENKKYFI